MVKSDVSQGTVLGPLFFPIYINDIESQITSFIHLFADDSALYRPIYSESDSLSLQEDIFKLQKWANTWQMAFNVNFSVSVIESQLQLNVCTTCTKGMPYLTIFILAMLDKKHLAFLSDSNRLNTK